jgi:hypothetical protein
MLPSIGTVLGAEVIRDGGSLGAFFVGTDSVDYWLFFGVIIVETSPGYCQAKGYADPVIIDRLIGTRISISWQHAQMLLGQMLPLLKEEAHRLVAESMTEIAENAGVPTARVIAQYSFLRGPRKVHQISGDVSKA